MLMFLFKMDKLKAMLLSLLNSNKLNKNIFKLKVRLSMVEELNFIQPKRKILFRLNKNYKLIMIFLNCYDLKLNQRLHFFF